MKVTTPCLSCNNVFESYASQKKKFCSRDCMLVYGKTEKGCKAKSEKINETKQARGTAGHETRQCSMCTKDFNVLKSETKQFCSKNCRYKHLSENKDSMLDKQHNTNLKKYGYKYPTQNKDIIESIRQTAAEKYGNAHPRFSDDSMKKRIQTCVIKYGKPYAPSFSNQSKDEKDIVTYIKSLISEDLIEENNRTLLNGKEIDIHIPSKNIAIEYDGLYYHSESKIADRKYHLNKTKALEKLGIRLIHIFSDEWQNKQELVKNKLKNILGSSDNKIYARKCIIKEITPKEANVFLEANHIQGGDKSKHKIGLYYNNLLVALMTFSVGRNSMGTIKEEGKWELSRFASVGMVLGGASKLLNYFIKTYKPTKIISYADKRWSVGNLYKQIGFKKVSESAPSYWYTKDYRTRLYRYNFRKSILLGLGADANKTEWEIMQDLGYDRIWDCGTIKYEFSTIVPYIL